MSFRLKILLSLAILIAVITAGIVTRDVKMALGEREDFLLKRANLLADNQAIALSSPMWNFDEASVLAALKGLQEDPDVIGGEVRNSDGSVAGEVGRHIAPDENGVTLTRAIPSPQPGDGKAIGELKLWMSRDSLGQFRDKKLLEGVLSFAILLAVSVGAVLVVLWQMTRPLTHMAKTMNQLAQGNLNVEAPFQERDDEIGDMARAIAVFKKNAIELHTLHDSLSRKIEERTAELEEKTANLERSNSDLEQFAYVASHDLQEPLRMVVSYVQLLEKRHGSDLQGDAKEYISFVVEGAKRMSALIKDLLEYSRAGTVSATLQPIDLNKVAASALSSLAAAIGETGAQVNIGPLPTVLGNPESLSSVLQNLIGNALKYRHPDRSPQIRVEAQAMENAWVISASDNGIGIAPEYFDRIFILFQRLHGRQDYEGTGIGLAICKKIVERHGGHIWLTSIPDKGTTFFFSLPMMLDPTEPKSGRATQRLANRGGEGINRGDAPSALERE